MRWLRLHEAARLRGETPDAIRQRIGRGTFEWPAELRGRHWWIGVPEATERLPITDQSGPMDEQSRAVDDRSQPIEAEYRVLDNRSLALVDRLTDRYRADIQTINAFREALEGLYEARLADKDQLIALADKRAAEWQERAQEARQEAKRLREQLQAMSKRSRPWWRWWG